MPTTEIHEILRWRPAKLHTGKSWYIGFYAYDPQQEKLRQKCIKLNHIQGIKVRREYANSLIKRINRKLDSGWNPWIENASNKGYKMLTEAIGNYELNLEKSLKERLIRKATFDAYNSYCKNVSMFLEKKHNNELYAYQFDKSFVSAFLDHIYIERDNTAITHDNYLSWLRVFARWMISKDYIAINPVEGFTSVRSRNLIDEKARQNKEDEYIPETILHQIKDYCIKNKHFHFLLACQTLYYTFLRPTEMTHIKIRDIDLENSIIRVYGETAKNHKNSVVTIPDKLRDIMIELKIQNYPSGFYLFSTGFKPGEEHKSNKRFRDFWLRMRNELKFDSKHKFYSLKHTGQQNIWEENGDAKATKDQARHHSIKMTEIYDRHKGKTANPKLKRVQGKF